MNFVKLVRNPNSLSLLRPHPDHPVPVLTDHNVVHGREPVHLTPPHLSSHLDAKPVTVQQTRLRTNFQSL
jgi:hypothetical protein